MHDKSRYRNKAVLICIRNLRVSYLHNDKAGFAASCCPSFIHLPDDATILAWSGLSRQ
uniref:Uncharacterized protein n=1 Tax=Arundo donax TaxID=35708 RepID=A0A0A9FPH8_ARUDO